MGFFDSLDDVVSSAWDKTQQAVGDVNTVLSTPAGVILDSLKWTVSDETFKESMGNARDRLGEGGAALTDALTGEGSLTGWAFNRTNDAFNRAWTAIENPAEALIMHEFMPPNSDPVTWSEAWDLAKDRSIGETAVQWKNEVRKGLDGAGLGGVGDALLKPSTAMVLGPGTAFGLDKLLPGGSGDGDDYQSVGFSDPKAVEKYREYDPASGLAADALTFGAQWVADPFAIAARPLKGMRELRAIDPVYREGSAAAQRASAASKAYNRILPERKGKFGEKNLDELFGTVTHKPTGELDDDGVEATQAVMDRLGWIDEHTDAEIYVGLGLDRLPASTGNNLAALLGRTKKIEDAASRVNTRRLIYAAAHGDAAAVKELQATVDSGPEMARILANASTSRADGSIQAALRDAGNADAIADGTAVRTLDDPRGIAEAAAELEEQAGYQGWLFASLRDRSLRVTTKGERAVARLRGQGLGRDGTLHTGWTPLDSTVNRVIGGIESPISKVDNALNQSGALRHADEVRPQGLAGGKVFDSPEATRWAGYNQMPVTALKAGWGVAKVAAVLYRPSTYTKIADSIRGLSTPSGALMIEDEFAPQVFKVMQERMRTTGMDPEFITKHLDDITRASNPTQRSLAVKRAEADMIGQVARRHGVAEDTVKRLSQHLSFSQDEVVAAVNGQRYSAHQKTVTDGVNEAQVPGDIIVPSNDGLVFFRDDQGTMLVKLGKGNEAQPILSTQTPNFLPLHDVRHAEKWLKRDRALAPYSRVKSEVESDGGLIAQTERLGIHRRVEQAKHISDGTFNLLGSANSWWKRSVLGLRPVSYMLRNTSEEMMRVAAASHVAMWVDEATRQGTFSANQIWKDARGSRQWAEGSALITRREVRAQELDTLRATHHDPDIARQVKAAQDILDTLDDPIEREFLQGLVLGAAKREDDMARLEAEMIDLDGAIDKLRPASGTRMIDGVAADAEFPNAFHGQAGVRNSDFLAGTTQLDYETTGAADRFYGGLRSHNPGGIITLSHPAQAMDPIQVKRHTAAWERILNLQIRQAPEAMVAVRALAKTGDRDEALGAVASFLRSPKARRFRQMNPIRSADLDSYADEIVEMVTHHVPTQNMATALTKGEISREDMLRDFADVAGRPDVHATAVDALVGISARTSEVLVGKWLQYLDKMGPQRTTRHPMFSVFYADEQTRLAREYSSLRQAEFGEGAALSVDDINHISQRASQHASAQIKRMFYDASVRSTAADRLRFIYPFFAAHQDSMRFWGMTIAQDPVVLRRIQQLFQVPAQVGLVVDYEGNPVKPGEFPSSDHYVLMQVPKNWGGPDPKDPSAMQSRFKLSLSSFNLITQNGSILNPGAGPMAAIPAGWIQRNIGASDEDISKAMTWFNPFGAPKNDESTMGFFDPAMPTPAKRAREAWNAFRGKDAIYSTQLYSQRLVEAQVKFQKENGRVPNSTEAKAMVRKTADEVKYTSLMRFAASLTSPSQPQPQSRMQGFINEYRRLQNVANEKGHGPLWATDKFLETYGDEYLALTKSGSEYRANLNPSYGTVDELKANEKLVGATDSRTWQVIVGNAGEGAFSTDSYRWMQNKVVDPGTGDTMIDQRSPKDRLYATAVAQGWRDYNKINNTLQAIATEKGFESVEESEQLYAMKQEAVRLIAKDNPLWYEAKQTPVKDFESEVLPSLEKITKSKLAKDPARNDIGKIADYIAARKVVQRALDQRAAAGGAKSLDAEANRDIAIMFARFVAGMAQSNTVFADYALPGLIEKDPMYMPDLIGGDRG